ncbi:MAG: hypothetical protein JNM62_00625 [Flavobacteriales bacterium]|nr:hypothetical protein [Flavobacteriales bacterium]
MTSQPFRPFLAALFLTATATVLQAQTDMVRGQDLKSKSGIVGGAGKDLATVPDKGPFVPNTFTGSFRLVTHRYLNGKEVPGGADLLYWSTPEHTSFAAATPANKALNERVLVDLKAGQQYILRSNAKGERFAEPSAKRTLAVAAAAAAPFTVELIDETRTIGEYECIKVLATSPEGTWTCWMVKDVPPAMKDMGRTLTTPEGLAAAQLAGLSGFVMEYDWKGTGGDAVHGAVSELVVGTVDGTLMTVEGCTLGPVTAPTN